MSVREQERRQKEAQRRIDKEMRRADKETRREIEARAGAEGSMGVSVSSR